MSRSFKKQESFKKVSFSPRNNENQENGTQLNSTPKSDIDYAPPSVLQQQVSTLERLMKHESWLDLNPSEKDTPPIPADDDDVSVGSLKEELDGVSTMLPDIQRELAQLELELGLSSPREETLQRNQDDAEDLQGATRRDLQEDLVASPPVKHRILRKPRSSSSESLDSLPSSDTAPKSVLLLKLSKMFRSKKAKPIETVPSAGEAESTSSGAESEQITGEETSGMSKYATKRQQGAAFTIGFDGQLVRLDNLDDQGALSDSASTTEDSVDKDPPNIIDQQDAVPKLPQDDSFMGKWKKPNSMLFASSAIMVASLIFGEPKSDALNLVSFRYC
jgi:hypothetical protein